MSDLIAYGGVGLCIGLIAGSVYGQSMLTRYLRLKAKPEYRTPAKIGDGFFYIVPESEYVRSQIAQIRDPAA